MRVIGAKGGDKEQRAAVEAPDSLTSIAYARILDLVSEGEIQGLVNGMRSVFLNETPLANADGSLNFSGVTLDVRLGTQDQSYIQGYPAVESETAVGVALRSDQPYTRTFSNIQLSAARIRLSTPRLLQQNQSTGDTNGYRVEYAIDLKTADGAFVEVLKTAFDGKTTGGYERSHRVDFPKSSSGWTIRVRRLTPDSTSGLIADTTNVVSITEIVDAKFRYPNSALMGLKFDASQFQGIPTRAYHLRGLKIKVPTNYDPETRFYNGVWDGTFKTVYSNNPAWVYYDLVLSDRYGLGHMVKPYQVDRYELYRIAQYCDQMVPDGKGGTEPRFTCNLYLQKRADALKVIQDIAAIFRGMSYWGAGMAMVTSDMPEDPVFTYTNGNVVDGLFDRMGTGKKTRYSVALVSWTDITDFSRAKVEYVEDRDALALYGHRQMELAGVGLSSQGQAQRAGRWALLTNKLETDTINFTVALDGTLVRPGKIVRIADNKRAGRRIGGRVRASTLTQLTLDSEVVVKNGDTIHIPLAATGSVVSRTVTSSLLVNGVQVVGFEALPSAVAPQAVWAVDSVELATEQYRILSIAEDFSGDNMQFKVTATKHIPGKFAAVDTGTRIESRPVTIMPPSVQPPPTNIELTSNYAIDQGNVMTTMSITWDAAPNATAYEVQWRMNNGSWINAGRTGTTRMEVVGILAGRYQARVQAFNSLNLGSVWLTSSEIALDSRSTPPPSVTFLRVNPVVFGMEVEWGLPEGLDASTTQRTELWYSTVGDLEQASKQGDYSYPTTNTSLMGLRAGVRFFFWARLVDKIGNLGPFFGPVAGNSEDKADVILDYIAGQIGKSELGEELLSEIDLITAPANVVGSVDNRLKEVQEVLTQDINNLQVVVTDVTSDLADINQQIETINGQIAGIENSGVYIPTDTYTAGQSVRGADEHFYIAKKAVPVQTPPPNTEYWTDVGEVAQTANGLASRVTVAETSITNINDKVTSQASLINGLRTDVDGKASQSAMNAITTRVTSAEGKLDTQGSAITSLQGAVAGKANTSAVDALTTRVTDSEKSITAATNRVTSLESSVNNSTTGLASKASATSVSDLGNRVTSAEGTLSSQGQSLTQLNNNLTTTNTNVTAAQTAANNAATLAGSKGKTLVQAAAPAAADQLPQNLWIDITNGANTPKRWTGSAWVAVTDKVATDAATAAANALTQVQTKADASAVTALSNRVTATETSITSVSNNVTSLSNNLSNAGGENLAYNPDFNKAAGVANDLPEGYLADGPGSPGASTGVFALVPSFMNSGEKAQRITVTGINESALYRSIRNAQNRLPKIIAGQPICDSIYVKGTAGLGFRMFIQQVNAAGATLTTTNTIMYYLTGEVQRIALAVPNPVANAVSIAAFYRVYGSATVTDGYIDMARPQVEYGTVPTGWSNNGQVDASNLLATSEALSSLTSRVDQQGATLTSTSSNLVSLSNTVTGIQAGMGAYGIDPATGGLWNFDSSSEGWTSNNSTLSMPSAGVLRQTSTSGDPSIQIGGLNIDGRLYSRVRASITRRAGTVASDWDGRVYYATSGHGFTDSYMKVLPNPNLAVGESRVIEFDMASLSAGGNDWITSTITNLRLDIGLSNAGVWDFDWVVVGRVGPSASSKALDALTSTVTTQGNTLTSVSGRTTSLENAVNSTTNGLATKASASAVNDLSSRVTSAEGVLTSNSSDITSLKNSIGSVGSFVAGLSFEFLNSNQGWIPQTSGATMTPGPMFSTISKYTTVQRNGLSFSGSENPYVRIRMRRRGTTRNSGSMYWANEDGGLAEARRANFTVNIVSEDWQDIEIDLTANTGWVGKTITAIRLDLMVSADTNGSMDWGYVAAGRRAAAASAQAFAGLTTTVTQQGNTQTAQATQLTNLNTTVGNVSAGLTNETTARTNADNAMTKRVDTLSSYVGDVAAVLQNETTARSNSDQALGQRIDTTQATVNNMSASVQQTSTAVSKINGDLNAQYSVKVMLRQNGEAVVAGFGLGLSNQDGVTQSQFIVSADRFAVLNANLSGSGVLKSPFAVVGGQVFIDDAFIRQATIINLLVSADINSTLTTNWGGGLPVMQLITRDAQIILRHQTRANTYTHQNVNGMQVIVDGVLRVRMGVW